MERLKKPAKDLPGEKPPGYEDITQPQIPPLNPSKSAGLPYSTTVTPDQCAAHLKFLTALADLRDSVANNDGLFGLRDSDAGKFPDFTNEVRARVREKRWAVYTARAVERYAAWWNALPDYGTCPTIETLQGSEYRRLTICNTQVGWNEDDMPPLDILMVWHSHMLNPRAFLEDCIRYAKMSLWHSGFPWNITNDSIHNDTMLYSPTDASRVRFENATDLHWNNLDDSPDKTVECPSCANSVSVPWTAGHIETPENGFEKCHGFSDKAFSFPCPSCDITIDHEKLKIKKFRNDLHALLQERRPMPGTYYNLRGVPETALDFTYHQPSFPNRFLWAANKSVVGITKLNQCTTVADLRRELETRMNDKDILREASGGEIRLGWGETPQLNGMRIRSSLLGEEKVSFRRMMSRYWDNATPFALDLVGAVTRQGVFVRKMDDIDWLHSPTVMSTMERLIKKYRIFLDIMMEHPRNLAVPTLDVDLAWHTHQLTPSRYYHFCLFKTGQKTGRSYFIDHDDKVDENTLSDGFEWTSKMYRKLTKGGIYSECTCWYCQAVIESDVGGRSILTTPSRSRARNAADNLHTSTSSDPNKSPHVSAHNAVQPQRPPGADPNLPRIKAMLTRNKYGKARRRAEKQDRKHGKKADTEKDESDVYSWALVWGYPLFMPLYLPFMADPGVHADVYASNPGCMSFVDGAAGNCAAGTCGGSVAAGGCGGLGASGSCSGGCAGGSGGAAACAGGAGCTGGVGGGCVSGGGGCGGGGGF